MRVADAQRFTGVHFAYLYTVGPRRTRINTTFVDAVGDSPPVAAIVMFTCTSDGNPSPSYDCHVAETGQKWTGPEYELDLCGDGIRQSPAADADQLRNVTVVCTASNVAGTDSTTTSFEFNATQSCQRMYARGNGC
jgi:hypothetical protein